MRALPAPEAPASQRQPPRDSEAARGAHAARRSAVERLAADRAKYVRSLPGASGSPASEDPSPGSDSAPPARAPAPVARRIIARKPLRPDSLVIYRQKCEFVRGPGADGSKAGLVRKLFQGPGKDRAPEPLETPRVGAEGEARGGEAVGPKASQAEAAAPPACARSPTTPAGARELRAVRRGGLHRSQSDLSSRYSMAKSEIDTFFQHCGLDPEVVEALGRENFSAGSDRVGLKVRSVSVATSDCGFSRHSSGEDDGLQEEIMEQVPSTTSVVEKNARIIKWLFACKKAKETSSPEPQGPA